MVEQAEIHREGGNKGRTASQYGDTTDTPSYADNRMHAYPFQTRVCCVGKPNHGTTRWEIFNQRRHPVSAARGARQEAISTSKKPQIANVVRTAGRVLRAVKVEVLSVWVMAGSCWLCVDGVSINGLLTIAHLTSDR